MLFRDRQDAGRILAARLSEYEHRDDVIVLGLPRGGVPVAYAVARALNASLDIFLVRKLGTPGQEELALGAIASGGIRVLNHRVVEELGIAETTIEEIARREQAELIRGELRFRGERPPLNLSGKTVILVDDGLATGSTMRAAARAVKQMNPAELVIAVPVAARQVFDSMRPEADVLICAHIADEFYAVGEWYQNFNQINDNEVRALLTTAAQQPGPRS